MPTATAFFSKACRATLCASVAVLGLAPQAAYAQPVDRKMSVQEEISYGPLPAQTLDLCLPSDVSRAPAVILIHGGGWRLGDKHSFLGVCRLAASHGVVAVAINYRLASRDDNRWPAQIIDVQLAIRWLRANADQYKVDARRICAWGSSAGAQLAVFAGTAKHTLPGDIPDTFKDVSSAVACVVDDAGPVDLTDPNYQPPDRQLFGSKERDPEAELRMSPLFQVEKGDPPMLIVHGRADPLVPLEQAERLVQELKKNDVSVKVIFHDGGHGVGALPPAEQRSVLEAEIAFVASRK